MIIQQETYRSAGRWKNPGDSCLTRREKTEKKQAYASITRDFSDGGKLVALLFWVNYIQMQSELTARITEVSRMR